MQRLGIGPPACNERSPSAVLSGGVDVLSDCARERTEQPRHVGDAAMPRGIDELAELRLRCRAVEGIPQLADLARGDVGLALLLADVARIDVRLHSPQHGLRLDARFRVERVPEPFDAVGVAAVEGVDEGLHGKRRLGHQFDEAERTRHATLDTQGPCTMSRISRDSEVDRRHTR